MSKNEDTKATKMSDNKYLRRFKVLGINDPYQVLETLNYHKIQDFINDHPNMSYSDVLKMLFKKPDVEIEYYFYGCLREEIFQDDTAREIIKDACIRYMKEFKISWKRSSRAFENRRKMWFEISNNFGGEELSSVTGNTGIIIKIWEYLEYRVPPHWIPENSDDPILTEAFDKFWPVDKKNQNVENVEKNNVDNQGSKQ